MKLHPQFTTKLYNIFDGEELQIAETIQRLRLKVLVHSCIYYHLNGNVIEDKKFDDMARELVKLQTSYPIIAERVCYADAFKGFDGHTGFDLPITDPWVVSKAEKLYSAPSKKTVKQEEPKRKKGRLI